MPTIIDTNHDTTHKLQGFKDAGTHTIIRYINPIGVSGEKTIKIAEAKAIAAAGLRLGLVCEGWGGTQGKGIDRPSGDRDGAFCRDYAWTIGAPDGAAVYFAVDVDASASYIVNNVLPYFQEVAKDFQSSKYRVGVYGCGAVCKAVKNAGFAQLTWLSNAMGWNGSRDYKALGQWNILQHLPALIAGLDTDPNEGNPLLPDIGDFVPFGSVGTIPDPVIIEIPVTPVQIAKWLQMMLAKSGSYTDKIDGDIGPKSIKAIKQEGIYYA